ncbi:MAG: Fe-S protein assembly co-chaperone HscB [Burkholderiales bacterium]|nr:Fe-S protein assembly co-chaperone HscB [Burkholderiales bacterium]
MASTNPFDLFGLPHTFAIDEEALDKKYLDVQKKVHPDNFASASPAEKRAAEQWTTIINDSYATLKDPIKRAEALCAAEGHPVESGSSKGISEEFLMDQLYRREAIADAKGVGDTKELSGIKEAVLKESADLIKLIGKYLDEEKNPAAAAEEVRKLMFLDRQLKELE